MLLSVLTVNVAVAPEVPAAEALIVVVPSAIAVATPPATQFVTALLDACVSIPRAPIAIALARDHA
jgi:hypothetical protein